jgi:hypothetical protein
MPLLFAPTIGAALAARYWFLWVRCPACQAVDLRVLDRRQDTAVTRPNPPYAELVRLSPISIADEIREEPGRRLRKP